MIIFYYSQNSGKHFTYYYRFILKDIIQDIKEQPLGFPGGSDGKETACSAGDLGSVPGSGRSPEEENGNPLQYSCLENSMDRSLVGYSLWGRKELDMTEIGFSQFLCI